jgi:hypothetical protein
MVLSGCLIHSYITINVFLTWFLVQGLRHNLLLIDFTTLSPAHHAILYGVKTVCCKYCRFPTIEHNIVCPVQDHTHKKGVCLIITRSLYIQKYFILSTLTNSRKLLALTERMII